MPNREVAMKKKEQENRVHEVLLCVTSLPQNIINLHGLENMPEFLLHSMCQKSCFDLPKAAYFVDNPEFNHLKGVAGFHHPESYEKNHWSDPEVFTEHMKNATFNKKVRDIMLSSIKKNSHSEGKIVQEISEHLGFEKPNYLTWQIKYSNFGLFIFEPRENESELLQEHLHSGLHMLGFCPVF